MNPLIIVAQKEFNDGLRNRWFLSITMIFALLSIGLTGFGSAVSGTTETASLATTVASLASLAVFIIPLIALLIGYDSFVGEREQGTLLLLLTYPLTKYQLLLGKFLGQGAIIALAILLGFGLSGCWLYWQNPDIEILITFTRFILSAIALGLSFIAISYVVSINVSEKSKAAGLALVIWFFFTLVFDLAILALLVFAEQQFTETGLSQVLMLNPADIFRLINLSALANDEVSGVLASALKSSVSTTVMQVLLITWIIAPLIIAMKSFSRKAL
jgi:Cu-processing system permease protein